jgi:hypothetical protein
VYLCLAATSGTAATSRFDWFITLGIACALLVLCVTIVVRGSRADPGIPRTRRQRLRLKRARSSIWLLVALICLTIARVIVAPH